MKMQVIRDGKMMEIRRDEAGRRRHDLDGADMKVHYMRMRPH